MYKYNILEWMKRSMVEKWSFVSYFPEGEQETNGLWTRTFLLAAIHAAGENWFIYF